MANSESGVHMCRKCGRVFTGSSARQGKWAHERTCNPSNVRGMASRASAAAVRADAVEPPRPASPVILHDLPGFDAVPGPAPLEQLPMEEGWFADPYPVEPVVPLRWDGENGGGLMGDQDPDFALWDNLLAGQDFNELQVWCDERAAATKKEAAAFMRYVLAMAPVVSSYRFVELAAIEFPSMDRDFLAGIYEGQRPISSRPSAADESEAIWLD